MICEQGKVVSVDGNIATVEVIQQSSCQACSAKSACGTQLTSKLFNAKRHYLKMDASHLESAPEIGDAVDIEINESALLISSMLVYCLPLILMVSAALLLSHLGLSEIWVIVGSLIGFGVSLLLARLIGKYWLPVELFKPILARVCENSRANQHQPVQVLSAERLDA